jgi:hypothetical protein
MLPVVVVAGEARLRVVPPVGVRRERAVDAADRARGGRERNHRVHAGDRVGRLRAVQVQRLRELLLEAQPQDLGLLFQQVRELQPLGVRGVAARAFVVDADAVLDQAVFVEGEAVVRGAPGVVRLLDRLPAVVRDDLRAVEPLEVRLVAVAQLLDDVLLGARRGNLLAGQVLEQRTFDRHLVDRLVLHVEVEADLAGVGDFLRGEGHGCLRRLKMCVLTTLGGDEPLFSPRRRIRLQPCRRRPGGAALLQPAVFPPTSLRTCSAGPSHQASRRWASRADSPSVLGAAFETTIPAYKSFRVESH